MKHKKTYFIILLVALLLYPTVSRAGEVYMWIDENGVRHITDRPPEKPAKMIGKETYKRDSPEEIQRYEQERKLQRYQSELETEQRKMINRINEAAKKSMQPQKDGLREREIEQAKKDLEFEKKYQSRYEDERRNSQSQWRIDTYDKLKKQQDKEVEAKERKLLELINK